MAVTNGEDYSGRVSTDDPKDIDAGGTIQLEPGDALNQVQLVDPATPPPTVSTRPASRKTPPPLPPSASIAPVVPVAAPPPAVEPPKRAVTGKTIAIFVALVAVCAVLGMTVGNWARARRAPAPAPAAASDDGVMRLEPIEMQSEPSASPSSPAP
jgi:hypothetical protein